MGGRPGHHVRRGGRLSAGKVLERCDILGRCSEETNRLTRPFASDAMRRAHELVSAWMREAGIEVRRDNVGNLRGRVGPATAPTLLLGSHLDSVRNAGKYDGPLGVLIAIAAVQQLPRTLPYAIEIIAFADEEGLRFGTTYLGSSALAGAFDRGQLERTDESGTTMADAIRAFGGDPDQVTADRWTGGTLLGYCEVHIEQGPVLERLDAPVGIVSAIAGQSRFRISLRGEAGHAGTVPMAQRKDALAAAAELVLQVEKEAREHDGMVATVGQITVRPGAANVIPGEATLSLDIRHPDDSVRIEGVRRLLGRAREIAGDRQVAFESEPLSDNPSVPCAPRLVSLLTRAVEHAGHPAVQLASGAGHDAVPMAKLTEVGMLFVRCKGGVSHNPAESVTAADVAVAIDVLSRFLELLATQEPA